MGSTRLPGKAMADVCGKPLFERVWQRVNGIGCSLTPPPIFFDVNCVSPEDIKKAMDTNVPFAAVPVMGNPKEAVMIPDAVSAVDVVVCIDDASTDIRDYCMGRQIDLYQGDAGNVIRRMHDTAMHHNADVVVRVTGDNPLTSPALIRAMLAIQEATGAGYVAPVNHPRGVRSEVVTVETMERALRQMTPEQAVDDNVSGHLRQWSHDNVLVDLGGNEDVRFTVDYPEDLERVRQVYADFGDDPPEIAGLVQWWRERYG